MEPIVNVRGTEIINHGDHIDVRGPWPVYVKGLIAVQLPGKDRDIPVEAAREVVASLLQ